MASETERLSRRLRWLLAWAAVLLWAGVAWVGKPVVHAVFFYRPTCEHCHLVMTETFPPLAEKYGQQLQILQVDVTAPEGLALYRAAAQQFAIPKDRQGVPTLIVGETVLVGSAEIPGQFPDLISNYLAQDGVAWPALAGLPELIARDPALATTQPLSLEARLARDPVGNTLAVAVLTGMVLAMGYSLFRFWRAAPAEEGSGGARRPAWLMPALMLAGFAVAGYLAYVETTQSTAICGPVGDCNAVQQSAYARLFGILPIGVLGLAGYAALAVAWWVSRSPVERVAAWGSLALFGLALFGTLFSVYLTFLEPFVIGATCAWCLTSAVVMTALLVLSAAPAKKALSNLF